MRLKQLIVFLLLSVSIAFAQQPSRAQLKQALAECEQDLEASLQKVEQLEQALQTTSSLIDQRQALADSLINALKLQIDNYVELQKHLQMNADTLQSMVVDYRKKLDEVAKFYRKELQKDQRPWFFSMKGWKGFATGILIGGAVGLIYGILL